MLFRSPHLTSGGRGALGVAVRLHDHASGSLYSWFQNPSGKCVARLMNLLFGKGGAFELTFSVGTGVSFFRFGLIERATVTGGGHYFARGEENGLIVMVKGVAVAEAHRADGIPVIGAIGGYKVSALGLAVLGEGLEDHFEACFHGGGSIIGEENSLEGRRESTGVGILDQFLG